MKMIQASTNVMIVVRSLTVIQMVDGCFRIGWYAFSLMLYFHDYFIHPVILLWSVTDRVDVPGSPKDDHLEDS